VNATRRIVSPQSGEPSTQWLEWTALVVFVVNGQVEWTLGFLLGAGQAAGAWTAAHFAVERGAAFVRRSVVVIAVGSAIALLAGAGV